MKHNISVLFTQEQLQQRIARLAQQISQDYQGKELVVIGVLKGAFVFMADLVRQIDLPLRCDFLRVSSYNSQGKSGALRLEFDMTQPIENQEVLLVEDVLDTGKSLGFLIDHLKTKRPKSLNICCLLDKNLKPDISAQIRYLGFHVPQKYLVGYGLDLDGYYRELPYVGNVEEIENG
ncbi:MAG: hypoxanthine phosphoribosyltransferase [Deltaproteobacteria bacterium]|nr:hypoxanthine phosphoribosyltransferase [Deltaproteobacteria bacterium]